MNLKDLYLALRKRVSIGTKGRFQIRRTGDASFLLDMLNYIDRQIEAFGAYESAQQDALFGIANECAAEYFFDVGANWGYYSILACNKDTSKNMKVVAFEPDAVNRNQMYANIFLNGLSDIISVQDYALSDQRTVLSFERHQEENRGRSRVALIGTHRVQAKVFDQEFTLVDRRVVFKIDVEGHELAVLKGMTGTLERNSCVLQVEAFGENADSVESLMKSHGYRKIGAISDDYYYTNIPEIVGIH